ncbi:MAG: hypothetical protein JXK95_03065 [Bacteroidales bacterium]|nr:hypothetical protein [Bacteroidales bacterium]
MRKINALLLVFLFILLLPACEKDKDLTRTEIITQKPWILTASTVNPALETDYGLISDFFAIYPDCLRDDIWVFKTTGSFTKEEGVSRCNQSDPTVWDVGTWSFSSDETVLITSSDIYGISEYEIVELTTAVMKLRYEAYDTLNNIYSFNESYGH